MVWHFDAVSFVACVGVAVIGTSEAALNESYVCADGVFWPFAFETSTAACEEKYFTYEDAVTACAAKKPGVWSLPSQEQAFSLLKRLDDDQQRKWFPLPNENSVCTTRNFNKSIEWLSNKTACNLAAAIIRSGPWNRPPSTSAYVESTYTFQVLGKPPQVMRIYNQTVRCVNVNSPMCPPSPPPSPTPEPYSGVWSRRRPMAQPWYSMGCASLSDGRAFLVGGWTVQNPTTFQPATLYDRSKDSWTNVPNPLPDQTSAIVPGSLPMLADGSVLSLWLDSDQRFIVTKLWNSSTQEWSDGPAIQQSPPQVRWGRVFNAGVALAGIEGGAIVTGCNNSSQMLGNVTQIWKPGDSEWVVVASMMTPRRWHAMASLHDGRVLVCGGRNDTTRNSPTDSCELYDPRADKWTSVASLLSPCFGFSMVTLSNGRVVAVGGRGCRNAAYDVSVDEWTLIAFGPTRSVSSAYSGVAAFGREVLFVGGQFYGYSNEPPTYSTNVTIWSADNTYACDGTGTCGKVPALDGFATMGDCLASCQTWMCEPNQCSRLRCPITGIVSYNSTSTCEANCLDFNCDPVRMQCTKAKYGTPGHFPSLSDCEANCLQYNCVHPSGVGPSSCAAVHPFGTPGEFPTMEECKGSCGTWSCSAPDLTCQLQPFGSPGFSNESECRAACVGYSCDSRSWTCTALPYGVRGEYNSSSECQSSCVQYECTTEERCHALPPRINGTFTNMSSCQSQCLFYSCNQTLKTCSLDPYGQGTMDKAGCQRECVDFQCNSSSRTCEPLPYGTPGKFQNSSDCHDGCTDFNCDPVTKRCVKLPYGTPGNFSSENDCEESCLQYFCDSSTARCVQRSYNASGQGYPTFESCASVCTPYACADYRCTALPYGSRGSYNSTGACILGCVQYNCSASHTCVAQPYGESGQFPSVSVCQEKCRACNS